ncbi:MAG: DMT family transporter [Crocinitomicaceae bacterium]|nr:DMT family transporter [Crocinitomicaceae bacterium]
MLSKYKHYLLLHAIIFIWGFTGILGHLIELEAYTIVWYRVLIAAAALAVMMPLLKTSFRVKSRKRLIQIGIVGILVGLHWVTFYKAIQLSTASLGVLCLATTTLHVSWLEPIIMKRRFSWVEFLLSLIVVYGIYFVSGEVDPSQYIAIVYGLSSALFAACFAVFNAKLAEDVSPVQISFYEMLTAFLFLTVVLFFQGKIKPEILDMRWEDFWWLLFLGVVCTSFAFLITIRIMQRLGAFTVSLSINLEPVYTFILAIFILNENEFLSAKFYIGSLVIVLVVILNGLLRSWKKRKPA